MRESFNSRLFFLTCLFVALYVAMNLVGTKIITVFSVSASVGIFMAPLLFLITDIIEEVYGREVVSKLIYSSIISLTIVLLFVVLFVNLPPAARFVYNTEYKTVFGLSTRIIIASIVAFFLSQMNDMYVFDYLKKRSRGKKLWLRNNISTMLSQTIDTFVFMILAFWHITDKFTLLFVVKLALPYLFLKLIFALVDTPFVYLGVKWLKKGGENE